MSEAVVSPVSTHPPAASPHPSPDHHAPVTPGKVAMWLFLATEVMFFTGLIGSYIVLRAGSTHTAYSNIYPPATSLEGLDDTKVKGIVIHSVGSNEHQIEEILRT